MSNETKWTSGPWTHRNGRIFQTDREELTIAKVAIAFDGDFSAANGAMLAAAPDLYEALRKLSFAAQTTGGTAGRDEELCKAIDEATAALAKARGEA